MRYHLVVTFSITLLIILNHVQIRNQHLLGLNCINAFGGIAFLPAFAKGSSGNHPAVVHHKVLAGCISVYGIKKSTFLLEAIDHILRYYNGWCYKHSSAIEMEVLYFREHRGYYFIAADSRKTQLIPFVHSWPVVLIFQRSHINHKTVFHITFFQTFKGFINLVNIDEFNVGSNIMLCTKIKHFLGFCNTADV